MQSAVLICCRHHGLVQPVVMICCRHHGLVQPAVMMVWVDGTSMLDI